MKYLEKISLETSNYGPIAYLYFKKNVSEEEYKLYKLIYKKTENYLREYKIQLEFKVNFEKFIVENKFLYEIIQIIPNIIIAGYF